MTQEMVGSIGAIVIFSLAFLALIVVLWPGGVGQVLITRRLSNPNGNIKAQAAQEPYRAPTAKVDSESDRLKSEIALQEYRQVARESNEIIQALIDQLKENGLEPVRKLNGRQERAASGELPAVELVNLMEQCFDENDLDDILLRLGIIPGAIGGDTLPGRMRNLVRYCQRRGRLTDLVNVCRLERPRIKWPDVG